MPSTGQPGTALVGFQRDMGLIESGDITPEPAWKMMMAFGGRQALLDLIVRTTVGPAKRQMPDKIYAASGNPAPRASLADELLEYGEQTRCFGLSLFLRGQGDPCSDTTCSFNPTDRRRSAEAETPSGRASGHPSRCACTIWRIPSSGT